MYSRIYGLVTTTEGTGMTRSADISYLVIQFPGTTEVSPSIHKYGYYHRLVPAVPL